LVQLFAKIDVDALKAAASAARGGVPCRIPAVDDPAGDRTAALLETPAARCCGGANCNVDVEFADGVVWVARVRQEDPLAPPAPVQRHVVLAEVATLAFLELTAVPAPRVRGYRLASPDNPVGVAYLLMEKMPGRPLDWHAATARQRAKVMEQLADVYLELERHPIPMMGSLLPSDPPDSPVAVGGVAQVPWFENPDRALGPFETLEAAYSALLHQQLRAIESCELAGLPVDSYLARLWGLSALPALAGESESARGGPFFLRHFDDKGDHILVDDAHNITGIIDWEFASAETRELAFGSPSMMWPVAEFYDGENALTADEVAFAAVFEGRGRRDLARLVLGGRRWQRFLFFRDGRHPADMADFEALFQGVRQSFAGDGVAISSYQDWKREWLEIYSSGNPRLRSLLRDERSRQGARTN
jgi:hypothetical protein